ncbi:MAG: hypothetical protein EA398_03035 [Deltaproteobacteria bacterium]|nr:MAG: hypothetical protein EA398_03035 [Deltaproteobacteria bacterium]
MAALLVASFTAFPAACSDDDAFLPGETVTIALVTPTWSATAPEEDPFAPLVGRVSNRCTAWQPAVEGSILEFSTRACDAMTVEAPLGIDLPAGTRIHLATTHAILTAEAPSTGWIGLAIGDQVLVARDVPIPGPASAYADTAVLPCAASATQPLRLHVSNHGPNSWRFVTLQATLPR